MTSFVKPMLSASALLAAYLFAASAHGTVRPVLPADAGASGQRTRCNLRRSIEECGPASFCQLGAGYGLPL
jgi:hypothetical protein